MTLGAPSHLINPAPGNCALFSLFSVLGLVCSRFAVHLSLTSLASGRLVADVHCEEAEMFCSNCHQPVFYNDLEKHGWCERCKRVVEVSPCSASLWCIAAALLLPWLMSV
jgi:hypothetical protein